MQCNYLNPERKMFASKFGSRLPLILVSNSFRARVEGSREPRTHLSDEGVTPGLEVRLAS